MDLPKENLDLLSMNFPALTPLSSSSQFPYIDTPMTMDLLEQNLDLNKEDKKTGKLDFRKYERALNLPDMNDETNLISKIILRFNPNNGRINIWDGNLTNFNAQKASEYFETNDDLLGSDGTNSGEIERQFLKILKNFDYNCSQGLSKKALEKGVSDAFTLGKKKENRKKAKKGYKIDKRIKENTNYNKRRW